MTPRSRTRRTATPARSASGSAHGALARGTTGTAGRGAAAAAAPASREIDPVDGRRLERARELAAAMTPAERISLLHQYSAGVERLGIGPFVTGTEGVHGLAWRGAATQFPQPVGLAATWDRELLAAAAGVVAEEVRELRASDPSVSLTVWAPVVNLLRHPLWGRTEEAYSEDPLLTAELGTAYSRGLRGPGGTWRTVPTLKHFLAYSNETDRCATSSDLSGRVLHEYELPVYTGPAAEGVAGSVMLAYNLVNGRPAHLSELLETQLRAVLPDPDLLFAVTDAGAPSNLFRSQRVVGTAAEAYAAMLRAGVDSFTDHDRDSTETVAALTEALERGLIEESHLERAVVRQLVARARTGELAELMGEDPLAADAPAPGVPATRAARRALSREVATRAAVLLSRRDEGALPLPAGPIALLGAQAEEVHHDWYSGDFHEVTSLAEALEERLGAESVRRATGRDTVTLAVLDPAAPAHPGADPMGGAAPEPLHRAADGALRADRAAAHPATPVPAPESLVVVDLGEDVIALRATADDRYLAPDDRGRLGLRSSAIGGWVVQETFHRTVDERGDWTLRHLGSGRMVGVEAFTGDLVLTTSLPGSAAPLRPTVLEHGRAAVRDAVDGARAAVLVVGNDPHVHGRETEDRPHVRLAAPDLAAAEALADLAGEVATVLVITSSYPYDLGGLEERIGAVVWSSHAGEAEGEALADLLTGARDFSGRLAQTWPDSSPLPSVLDYDVIGTGATYLYGQGARFPFGHGLAVDPTSWPEASLTTGPAGITARVRVAAPSERRTAGPLHEVVQVYADVPAGSFSRRRYAVPTTRLIGFASVVVPEVGSAEAVVEIPWQRLALFAPDLDAWELPDGPVTVRLARSSARTETAEVLHVPAAVRAEPVPAAGSPTGGPTSEASTLIPAARAEETVGLLRSAATLLEGTVLRPAVPALGGTAEFVLPAGSTVLAGELEGDGEGTVELVDPTTPSAASAVPDLSPLPFPHVVPADGDRPTGRVRVRLTGRAALVGLRVTHP
ncbi:glycoside hydrolase family 3 N-terminal domain-containing protein [Brachybacterium sp. J153]|uniref:glycoside hydrolase family 3 N-terminal domain-containing protein n=1 Tax=Brachybacterium sp. J153 TaxID=3116488 RepID=UPI002E78CFB4|nr:glycoside hydrolase family 3 N-terminal domain-containing protein [Brachybacterium sp. J153]MEE1618718.1 glycoside hydrolase family 3 N-terminal domain-containing protein [Brachybacterium sp. J153]